MKVIKGVDAAHWSCWSMSWRGFFGGLPKIEIICGNCGRGSKSEPTVANRGEVIVWCTYCGMANRCAGLTT